jgi:hypothetical protein
MVIDRQEKNAEPITTTATSEVLRRPNVKAISGAAH